MKKLISAALCMLLAFTLAACGGNVDQARTHTVDSENYSQAEINAAIGIIKNEFRHDWKGCTLTEIYYAGDAASAEHQDWAARNQADDVLVLLSSFDVDPSGGDGSLNPNSTYENWMWILVRTKGGRWKHVDHGY